MSRHSGLVALLLLAAACTVSGEDATDQDDPPPTTATVTTTVDTTTTTTATTVPITAPPPEPATYLVVAEEAARALAIIGAESNGGEGAPPCDEGEPAPCGRFVLIERFDLPDRPHNLAASGSIVLATHPAAGTMSRLDVATGELLTAPVGAEPHDVKIGNGVAYVADERGRELLVVDPWTLQIIDRISLPYRPHDLFLTDDAIWVTMLGTDRFAVVTDGEVDFVPTGRAPHDLLVTEGRIWFSNWGSNELSILDPETGEIEVAPAGVIEPHHFAVDESGVVWVSDNGGDSLIAFADETVAVVVGPHPHHLVLFESSMAVAVSGSGEAVFVEDGQVVARVPLSVGLHGVAVVVLE